MDWLTFMIQFLFLFLVLQQEKYKCLSNSLKNFYKTWIYVEIRKLHNVYLTFLTCFQNY